MRYIFIFILLILSSCDPVRRHAKLVERYPYIHKNDTVISKDTIQIIKESILIDTFTAIEFDTFVVEKEKAKVKLVKFNDTIFVDAECLEDTFYVEKEKIIIEKHSEQPKENILKILIIIGVALIIFIWIRK